jgi:uncharacterized HAD superfamily protein
MKQLRVGIDMDGCAAMFHPTYINGLVYLGLLDPKDVPPVHDQYPYDFFESMYGYTYAEFKDQCNKIADAGILFDAPIYPGAADAINEIYDAGHKVIIITDRPFGTTPESSRRNTRDWLVKYGINYDELIFSADKTCIQTDIFVEDKTENVVALRNVGTKCYMINRLWNESHGPDPDRISSITEFPAKVKEFATSSKIIKEVYA